MARTRSVTSSNPTDIQDEQEADFTLNEISRSAAAIEAAAKVRLATKLSLYVLAKTFILEKIELTRSKCKRLTRRISRRRKKRRKRRK